jgi:hypothetical protein
VSFQLDREHHGVLTVVVNNEYFAHAQRRYASSSAGPQELFVKR